jgi:hypothetical protein
MATLCIANGCHQPAVLMAVDNLAPLQKRTQIPACVRHVTLWRRQAAGTFWFFPLGEEEAASLTNAEISDICERATASCGECGDVVYDEDVNARVQAGMKCGRCAY